MMAFNEAISKLGVIELHLFGQAYPINVEAGKMENLTSTFGCQIGCFPFTYLGLPMGLTKPKVEDFIPLV
jgi:hypothetical protein